MVDALTCSEDGKSPQRNAEGFNQLVICGTDGKTPTEKKVWDLEQKTLVSDMKWNGDGSREAWNYDKGKVTDYEKLNSDRSSINTHFEADGKTPDNTLKMTSDGHFTQTFYKHGKPESRSSF